MRLRLGFERSDDDVIGRERPDLRSIPRAGLAATLVGALLASVSALTTAAPAAAGSPDVVAVEACQVRDLPDPAYRDANCDGIDGEINAARFVSPRGDDTNPCSRRAPCRTVQRAINRAVALGKRDVYAAGGSYQAFRVASGVNVFGGFGRNFQRDPAKSVGSRAVTVSGALAPADGHKVTVLADQVTGRATLADLTLRGSDATAPGASSYVIAAHGSTLQLTRLRLFAGDGANGTNGSDGLDAASFLAPPTATAGGNSDEASIACDNQSHGAGGPGRTNVATFPSVRNTTGGTGGAGGEMDTDCGLPFNFDATSGDAGGPAAFNPAGPPGDGGRGARDRPPAPKALMVSLGPRRTEPQDRQLRRPAVGWKVAFGELCSEPLALPARTGVGEVAVAAAAAVTPVPTPTAPAAAAEVPAGRQRAAEAAPAAEAAARSVCSWSTPP